MITCKYNIKRIKDLKLIERQQIDLVKQVVAKEDKERVAEKNISDNLKDQKDKELTPPSIKKKAKVK